MFSGGREIACNFTKSNTPPWVFFTFLKLVANGPKLRKTLHISGYFFCFPYLIAIYQVGLCCTFVLVLCKVDLQKKILQKYQSLSNQSFKHNLAHMTSLNLTPMFSSEPIFRKFTTQKANTCIPWTPCVHSMINACLSQHCVVDF